MSVKREVLKDLMLYVVRYTWADATKGLDLGDDAEELLTEAIEAWLAEEDINVR